MALPFGVMVSKLKRAQMLQDVMEVGQEGGGGMGVGGFSWVLGKGDRSKGNCRGFGDWGLGRDLGNCWGLGDRGEGDGEGSSAGR